MQVFEKHESNVRSYCRSFKDVFSKAKNATIRGESGREYIDFFAGAGALNYGHCNDFIKERVIDYIANDNIMHALDMHTVAKGEFLQKFQDSILAPRNLDFKVMFPGPTGTNAVEAALKIARKVKKRSNIFAFMGAFHGMTLGGLAATSNISKRTGAGVPLNNVTFMPYPHDFMGSFDTIKYIDQVLTDDHSGIEKPAAIIVETMQAEGGLIVSPEGWLKDLEALCRKHDVLLIIDEIQVGCGRTGTFFCFEQYGISPDIVVLSKSIGGYGFPMALTLIKPEYDVFNPGEHNGTFRGNQVAFVGAKAALDFRETYDFDAETVRKGKMIAQFVEKEILPLNNNLRLRGIGMVQGIDFTGIDNVSDVTGSITSACFEQGVIIERAGREDCVVKFMPPLTIPDEQLLKGLNIVGNIIKEKLAKL